VEGKNHERAWVPNRTSTRNAPVFGMTTNQKGESIRVTRAQAVGERLDVDVIVF